MEVNETFNYIEILYGKKGSINDITIPPIVLNDRLPLYSPELIDVCAILDKYIYKIKPYFYYTIMDLYIKKTQYYPKTRHIKEILEEKKQEEKQDIYSKVYDCICNHYKWGLNEKELYKKYYYNLFEDKDKFVYFCRFFDFDEKEFSSLTK